ncbi:MAG: glycoside hydrolase family 130 protein [Arachidicoccus sp.]|nr:glycoside hydrolase family 130 protein [Arachidicoccus sp.]
MITGFGKSFLIALCLFAFTNVSYCQRHNLPDWAFGGFVRPKNVNPIISPVEDAKFIDPMSGTMIAWEANYTFNPAAAIKNGKVIVLYRSEDKTGTVIGTRTSRIGYAASEDGLHFLRDKIPVLYPEDDSQKEYEWPGGCEDPRVAVTEDGLYVMFYTQWNHHVPRLGVATSRDLKNWKKHGPIFRKSLNGKFADMATKSASIVTKIKDDKQIITKVNGHYWMYWGEEHVYAAISDNLIDWTPIIENDGSLKQLISPRKGYFDSNLTECGPPAIITDKGILLLYNGKNDAGNNGDKRFAAKAYCAGQVLFNQKDPTKAIARLDAPFLRPMEPFEKSGQYIDGTVFIEGMAYFKKKWYLYYGCADSRVGVAVYDPNNPSDPDPL